MNWLKLFFNKIAMITHVAIQDATGTIWSLPAPNRHGDIIKLLKQNNTSLQAPVYGFLDHNKHFLTREEAWHEAKKCNQILPPYNPINPTQRAGKPNDVPGPLFSEDIW
jgi:hypothetical protein